MKKSALLTLSTVAILALSGCSKHEASHGAHWSYEGAQGPTHWGELAAEYQLCSTGKEQSPINITVTQEKTDKNLVLDYQASTLDEVNNGHTIKFNYDAGSNLTVAGKTYELLQFHFHAPSEHTVDTAHFPIEFHLVHQSAEGELAVIGVMVKEGAANKQFESIIANLAYNNGETVKKPDVSIDMNAILPATDKFAHYVGSLTTPPCSEQVQWFVLQEPIEFSKEQIKAFEKAYLNNFRPVQPLNERTLYTR